MAAVVCAHSFFPEAWLWEAVDLDSTGAGSAATVAPDTITSWQLSAFGVATDVGVAVAAAASELRVFKDFFVEPSLPYSIVRGEVATVRVGVYNYLDVPTTATVTLQVAGGVLEVRSIVDTHPENTQAPDWLIWSSGQAKRLSSMRSTLDTQCR